MNNTQYEIVLKELAQMKNQINDLIQRVEDALLTKHEANSNAIDDIVVAMLGGEK